MKTVYNKLVRDRIPEIIEASGKSCKTAILSNEEYLEMLDAKLDEELAEYHKDQNLEELAVRAAQLVDHRTLPLPRTIIAREPDPRINMLINRKPADGVHKERQNAKLHDRSLQIIYCSNVQIIDRHFSFSSDYL